MADSRDDDKIIFHEQNFKSKKDFELSLVEYQKKHKQQYVIRSSNRLLKSERNENSENQHYELIYKCKFGGVHRSRTQKIRISRTYRSKCPSVIRLLASPKRNHLIVKNINEKHQNHSGSEKYFEYFPINRRLTKKREQEVMALMEMRCPMKAIQEKIIKEDNKKTTTKDLHNIKAKLRNADDDTLPALVKLLEHDYKATVKVSHKNKIFTGLYFSTELMQENVSLFGDIIFVDGTYKLFKRNLTLMLIVVEDGNGETQYGGVGILADETRDTLTWFFNCFKEINTDAVHNIQCFMTDKDLTERSVIRNIFPNKHLYLCVFHTLRTFDREITTVKRKISQAQRLISLGYLNKLVKSKSEQDYNLVYADFSIHAPKSVLSYFNRYWHSNRSEWSMYSITKGNLGNTTNNRVESLNSKIKFDIQLRGTLVSFAKSFFKHMEHRIVASSFKKIQNMVKKNAQVHFMDSDECKYKNILTTYAFDYVKKEMAEYKNIQFENNSIDITNYKTSYNNGSINVTPLDCECLISTSMLLPCRHIFAVRKLIGMDLFDEVLCRKRWRLSINNKSFSPNTYLTENVIESSEISETVTSKVMNVDAKKSAVSLILNNIFSENDSVSNKFFEHKLHTLHQLSDYWDQGIHVSIVPSIENNSNSSKLGVEVQNLSTTLKDLSINKSSDHQNTIMDTSAIPAISLPKPTKMIGRSRKQLSCTIKTKKRTSKKKKT